MATIEPHLIKPSALNPNNPRFPLLHYRNLFSTPSSRHPRAIYDLFYGNDWHPQWTFRYGSTQRAHYHSTAHEAIAVLSGTATIRFGAADTDDDMEANTRGAAFEEGGVEIQVEAGDLLVIPAGVSHKTFNALPTGEFALLSQGDGHGNLSGSEKDAAVTDAETAEAFGRVQLSGFTMLGGYPSGYAWDSKVGGELAGEYERVWRVSRPETDPVFGREGGLLGLWK